MRATLKVMRDRTGSQCNLFKTGVMCSRLPAPVTTLASVLMTRWILLRFEGGSSVQYGIAVVRFGNQRLNQPQFVQCPRRYSGVCVAMPWCGRRMPCIRYRRGCWMRGSRRLVTPRLLTVFDTEIGVSPRVISSMRTLLSNSSARASDDHFRLAWVEGETVLCGTIGARRGSSCRAM